MYDYLVVFRVYQCMRQWEFGQAPIDHGDTGYIVDMLNRMPEDGAEWLVKFCRLVCDAVKGENDGTSTDVLDPFVGRQSISRDEPAGVR